MDEQTGGRIAAKAITVTFGGVDVVRDVDVELRPGEIHALVGENGAGKSSLAKVIAGVYKPRLGALEVAGKEIKFKNPREALRHGIALIHQEPLTFPDLDITENIFVGHQPGKAGLLNWPQAYRKAKEILDSLGGGLDPRARVGGLSVAQQQMVELAAAMSHQAKVWIFDETTAPLTPKEVEELFQIMRNLCRQGCAIAMVTHHLDEVFAIANRITVLRDGQKVAEKVPSETNVGEIVRLMVGRELSGEQLRGSASSDEAPYLEISSLSGPGFKDVSLAVRRGEVLGVAGLVGAGRTELARALFGITCATAGSILVNGSETRVRNAKNARKLGFALVPEDRQHDGLLMPQDIAFNSTLPCLPTLTKLGWLNRRRLRDISKSFAERLKLVYRTQDQPVNELSGGNQQKVVLSKWLMSEPKLLILDEPTRGVDVGAKHEVHRLIREQAEKGLAVLMISSDLPEILAICDRIVVMRQGTTVAALDGKIATEQQIMFAATGQEERVGA